MNKKKYFFLKKILDTQGLLCYKRSGALLTGTLISPAAGGRALSHVKALKRALINTLNQLTLYHSKALKRLLTI